MAHPEHTAGFALLEEAVTVLFCQIDDAYAHLNPNGGRRYESIKRLADSEVIALSRLKRVFGLDVCCVV